jgi:hypothetical protein
MAIPVSSQHPKDIDNAEEGNDLDLPTGEEATLMNRVFCNKRCLPFRR